MNRKNLFALPLLAVVAGCGDDPGRATPPAAVAITEQATGYYCNMAIRAHPGPKAQAHLAGRSEPLWFAQARDGIAYWKSPDQPGAIRALYVNDMGTARGWSALRADNWIDAQTAYFVAGSDALGGMGAPEIVPFGKQPQAEAFARRRGGEVMRLVEIPATMVLAPVELDTTHPIGHSEH